ncbi:hypothetical protein MLD38_011994 [Melastoma candidum]|uniref:Uncharacterized protein n=1 Tax=Melastoma candidum TaxID=119954 RepID=A0ACB9R672_9MYRT|nr:hypothetical protein MLD38_011994 [Melastoma candidum]
MKSIAPSLFISLSWVMRMIVPADSQASNGTSCASSLISTFAHCTDLLKGSSYNHYYSPTSDYCNSLKSPTGSDSCDSIPPEPSISPVDSPTSNYILTRA